MNDEWWTMNHATMNDKRWTMNDERRMMNDEPRYDKRPMTGRYKWVSSGVDREADEQVRHGGGVGEEDARALRRSHRQATGAHPAIPCHAMLCRAVWQLSVRLFHFLFFVLLNLLNLLDLFVLLVNVSGLLVGFAGGFVGFVDLFFTG